MYIYARVDKTKDKKVAKQDFRRTKIVHFYLQTTPAIVKDLSVAFFWLPLYAIENSERSLAFSMFNPQKLPDNVLSVGKQSL